MYVLFLKSLCLHFFFLRRYSSSCPSFSEDIVLFVLFHSLLVFISPPLHFLSSLVWFFPSLSLSPSLYRTVCVSVCSFFVPPLSLSSSSWISFSIIYCIIISIDTLPDSYSVTYSAAILLILLSTTLWLTLETGPRVALLFLKTSLQ